MTSGPGVGAQPGMDVRIRGMAGCLLMVIAIIGAMALGAIEIHVAEDSPLDCAGRHARLMKMSADHANVPR